MHLDQIVSNNNPDTYKAVSTKVNNFKRFFCTSFSLFHMHFDITIVTFYYLSELMSMHVNLLVENTGCPRIDTGMGIKHKKKNSRLKFHLLDLSPAW